MRLFVLIVLSCLLESMYAYPSAPGTCNMNKMATIGHGPSQSTCPDCYGVKISTDSPSLVNIHLTGRYAYQGIVLLVKDAVTNKTIGEFQDFDETLFTSVACDDDEDEQDQIEPDSLAVLGHIDPKLKQWPVDVGWNMQPQKPVTRLKLQGMVVLDYDNFHLLPETEFKIMRKIVPTTTTTTTVQAMPTVAIETIVEHDIGTTVKQETNVLFMWVLSFFVFFYVTMSVCYRQLVKKRLTAKKNVVSSLMQPDEITLVTSNPKDI